MSLKPFGSIDAISVSNFFQLPLHIQKEGVLLLQEMGLTKTEILERTQLYQSEYDRLFDGSVEPYKFMDFDE